MKKTKKTKNSQKDKGVEKKEVPKKRDILYDENEDLLTVFVKTLTGATLTVQLSKSDSNMEIKQILNEAVETCYITSFDLYHQDKKLGDYVELKEFPEIKNGVTLTMQATSYDDKASRYHLIRFREILETKFEDLYLSKTAFYEGTKKQDQSFPSFTIYSSSEEEENFKEMDAALDVDFGLVEKEEKVDSKNLFNPDKFTLSSMEKVQLLSNQRPKALLKSISYSGWNPISGNRKLHGDLYYLLLETFENKKFHITASATGFYVNQSTETVFDASPSKKTPTSKTLVGLLARLSKHFQTEFPKLLEQRTQRHPFESTPVPFPPNQWLGNSSTPQYDLNRAEDSLFSILGNDSRIQQRDWNEEYQNCKELPSGTLEERTIRDRTLFKIHCDFVEAATKGAKAVIDGCILPINVQDPEPSQVFIQNNIFYSYTVDSKTEKSVFGDRVAHINAQNDLRGINSLNDADVRGVHTLATAIIDYRGYRVLAQSIIPGILQGEQGSKHVYGSIDDGKNFVWDEKYHKLMKEISSKLMIKEHTVKDSNGKEYNLCFPLDCKGIIGADGRFYILEIVRTTPRDMNYPDDSTSCVRSELLRVYFNERLREYIGKKQKEILEIPKDTKIDPELKEQIESNIEKKKEETKQEEKKEETKTEEKKEEVKVEEKKEEVKVEEKKETPEEIKKKEEEFEAKVQEMIKEFDYQFNLNVPENDKNEKDLNLLKELADFIIKVAIPSIVKEFQYHIIAPLDGYSLTESIHERGINMRYLGEITNQIQESPHIKLLCEQEMFVRAAKYEFNEMLRNTSNDKLIASIEKFLNSLFENKSIIKRVEEKFKYQLKKLTPSIGIIRNFCMKVGLSIAFKDYNLSSPHAFIKDDILGLDAIVKHTTPKSQTANGLLEAGRQELINFNYDRAFEFLSQALIFYQQVKGPMNREVANCFHYLARMHQDVGDLQQSLIFQHKAYIVCKRVLGFDSSILCNIHQHLGILCMNQAQFDFALKHFLRAKYLCQLINGESHPIMINILQDLASIYQQLGDPLRAAKYMKQSLDTTELLFGKEHLETANVYHQMATVLSNLKKHRDALDLEKKSYKILFSKFGLNDFRVQESSKWLEAFTDRAVKQQKEQSLATIFKKQQLQKK